MMRVSSGIALVVCTMCILLSCAHTFALAAAAGSSCSYTAPDGTYFDFSGLASVGNGTQVSGDQSEVYAIDICGTSQSTRCNRHACAGAHE
jgi:hypothetical protein